MAYYIYRNWVAEKKAVIHKAECGYCNGGKGCHENPLGNINGEWSDSFKTFLDAKNDARKPYQGRHLKVKTCGNCKPHLKQG